MNKSSIITPLQLNNHLFSMLFSQGYLRKIHVQDKEIIQRIYFAVRDEEWLNIPYQVKNFETTSNDSVKIYTYHLLFQKEEIDFEAQLTILLEKNRLVIEAVGEAASNFMKNRIGLCMLLPASFKETPCTVTHTDKSVLHSVLPKLISPHQPFKNISEILLTLKTCKTRIVFEGDIFEMEDQRNWTDASYKIYSTPLENPFPVSVKKGDSFSQKITVTISEYTKKCNLKKDKKVEISGQIIPSPMIGVHENDFLHTSESKMVSDNLRNVFSHVRVDFRLYNKKWKSTVSKVLKKTHIINTSIYATLYFSLNYNEEVFNFIDYFRSLQPKQILNSIVLFSNEVFVLPDNILVQLVGVLRNSFPDIPIGAGTDANFVQLNRNQPNSDLLDFICYSIQPQEHASDLLSIIENLQGQSDTVETAQSFSGDRSIHISSLSLFRRFNANISVIDKEDNISDRTEYAGTNFEAAWYIGSLNQLTNVGVTAITCTCSLKTETPLFKFFRYLALHRPEYFYKNVSLFPEEYAVLSWKTKGRRHSVFANLRAEPTSLIYQSVKIELDAFGISYLESD